MAPAETTPHDSAKLTTDRDIGLAGGIEASSDTPMTSDIDEPTSAVEAIRYLYLARELYRLGQVQAADRWHAKAMVWLDRSFVPVIR
jgi:hypothetical protein